MYVKFLVLITLLFSTNYALATPKVQHWTTDSGARVYFVEDHSIPMLDISVGFPAGSAFDPTGSPGLAAMTHSLLNLGAGELNEDDIARKLADVGAQTSGQFDPDRANLSLRTLSSPSERGQALDVLARMLQTPHFDEIVLAREKARRIAALKEAETKPEYIATKTFNQAVFQDHPYGRTPQSADLEKLQRSEVEAFYRSHYTAAGTIVAIMGDISRAEAEAIAQQLTAQLPQGPAPATLPPVAKQIPPNELRIAHPASQSHILIGAPGVARGDPDYFPLYVGNYILGGGGFVSRLMDEVREKRGLAYSVYSYFMPMQQPGAFQAGLQTKKEQTDEALNIVRATLSDFIANGPTDKELKAAKDNIIGGFPLRIDSNREIVGYLGLIGFYGLPLTYLDDFSEKIANVTIDQVRDAFQRHLNPTQMVTIIVGAPSINSESEQ